MKKKILVIFGTRPEAIKLAPLILAGKRDKRFEVSVCSTGQHREMLIPVLRFFDIHPDFDLNVMKPGQTLSALSINIMAGLDNILSNHTYDAICVQGDTTTCFVASLIAFYKKIPVVHIEAGLRSGDIQSPFPEEFNRKATGLLAQYHFSPTRGAEENLLKEGVAKDKILVTGNTGIDALFAVRKKFTEDVSTISGIDRQYSFLSKDKKLVLVTLHRRESFGRPIEEIMKGILALSKRDDVEIVMPLHMNPEVRKAAERIFGNHSIWCHEGMEPRLNTIWLSEPVEYVPFVYLMSRSYLIVTDSGGVQEEAPSLGKPILIAREKTERPEGIQAGSSKLVPLSEHALYQEICQLLDDAVSYRRMSGARNPFGDGTASYKILDFLAQSM